MKGIEDDYFGLLRWHVEFQEWEGTVAHPPFKGVGIDLPPEYVDSNEVRKHIQETMRTIGRDEAIFRARAANDLFAKGGYRLFILENQVFDHDQFVDEMQLARISFILDVPEKKHILLGYEYGEAGMEHGISITLTWDGDYQYAS